MIKFENKTLDSGYPRIEATPEFIKSNSFSLKRRPNQIVEQVQEGSNYFFDFRADVLISYLPLEHAKQFLSAEFLQDIANGTAEWKVHSDIIETTQDFLDYLQFGWMKAMDQRGLSASRTILKLSAWLWLLGRPDLEAMVADDHLYNPYGMPALIMLSQNNWY